MQRQIGKERYFSNYLAECSCRLNNWCILLEWLKNPHTKNTTNSDIKRLKMTFIHPVFIYSLCQIPFARSTFGIVLVRCLTEFWCRWFYSWGTPIFHCITLFYPQALWQKVGMKTVSHLYGDLSKLLISPSSHC